MKFLVPRNSCSKALATGLKNLSEYGEDLKGFKSSLEYL